MAPKPPSSSSAGLKKAPKASRSQKKKSHTALGVAKKVPRGDKRTPKQRAADLSRLEKTLPTLNTVVPAGATGKVRGGHGKIGKVFVDDHDTDKFMRMIEQAAGKQESGEESKLERARKLEVIREARRKEEERKVEERHSKMDEAKDKVRRKRKGTKGEGDKAERPPAGDGKPKKRVGFA